METGITTPDKGSQQQVLRYEYVLGALSDIGDELCRVTSFDAQLKSLLHLLLGTLGVSKGGIFIYDNTTSDLSLKCSWKLSKKAVTHRIQLSDVEVLEKVAKPIFLPQSELPFLDELFSGFSADDLSCFAILKVREKFLGMVAVGQKLQKSSFEERETEFLSTLSRNISVAINNFLLLSELRETNKRLDEKIQEVSILYQATQMIASEIQLQALLELAMNLIIEISEGSQGSIWLFDEERNGLARKSSFGGGEGLVEFVGIDETPIGSKVVLEKEVLIVHAKQPALEPLTEGDEKLFGASFIILPILNQGEFLGFIHLSEKANQNEFSERDQRLIRVFAVQLGAAVKNAKLYEQAITDGMTHLYLHRYFKQRLFDEIKRAIRFRRHLSLIMVDIDYFKKFNDTYGHQMGDEVLKKVASILRRTIRTHDLPVRYGGEEFAVVLPETDINGAFAVAERIRRTIEIEHLEFQGKTVKITASFGVSVYPECAQEMESFIKSADEALYRSKENGRNLVTQAPFLYPPPEPIEE